MTSCTILNCERKLLAKGLCGFHYKRKLFNRELTAPYRPSIILPKKHPFYVAWVNMKSRCDNPKSIQYKYYGGRGIVYEPTWKEFKVFYDDMFEYWHLGLELDRKNTNANYNFANCRWITHAEQCKNRNKRGYLNANL